MALHLSSEQPNGVVLSYHRISFIQVNYNTGTVAVRVSSYVSQESRDRGLGYSFLDTNFTNEKNTDGSAMNPSLFIDVAIGDSISRAALYALLKQTPIFATAEDV